MKQVKVMPRFKCDFCNRRSTKAPMERHEKVCFRNPDRFCPECKNTGIVERDEGFDIYTNIVKEPCYYCSKFDPKMKEEIEAREKGEEKLEPINSSKAPF